MAVVVRTRRNVSLLVVVWILVGLVVAAQRGYITVALLKAILSALLAIVLWPLVLLGISLHLYATTATRGRAQSLISVITAPLAIV
jgi:hypothetical protein